MPVEKFRFSGEHFIDLAYHHKKKECAHLLNECDECRVDPENGLDAFFLIHRKTCVTWDARNLFTTQVRNELYDVLSDAVTIACERIRGGT